MLAHTHAHCGLFVLRFGRRGTACGQGFGRGRRTARAEDTQQRLYTARILLRRVRAHRLLLCNAPFVSYRRGRKQLQLRLRLFNRLFNGHAVRSACNGPEHLPHGAGQEYDGHGLRARRRGPEYRARPAVHIHLRHGRKGCRRGDCNKSVCKRLLRRLCAHGSQADRAHRFQGHAPRL